MKKIHFILCCILIITTFAYAHSGRTDSKGGHYNRSTGEYHYHHGYPAHTVCGVNCPYNNIDATNHSSSSSTKTSNLKAETSKSDFSAILYGSLLISLFTFQFFGAITIWIISKFKNIDEKYEICFLAIGYIESVLLFYFLFS